MAPRKVPFEKSLAAIRPDIAVFYSEENELKAEEIANGSHIKVKWDFSKDFEIKYSHYMTVKSAVKYGADSFPPHTWKTLPVILEISSLRSLYPDLSRYFVRDDEGETDPSKVHANQMKKYWWSCENDHHPESHRALSTMIKSGFSCRYCTGTVNIPGVVSFATENPEVMGKGIWSEDNKFSPDDILPGSDELVILNCYGIQGSRHQNIKKAGKYSIGQKSCRICKSFGAVHPNLVDEYSTDNDSDVWSINPGSHKKVKWNFECGHTGYMTILTRSTSKSPCSVCKSLTLLRPDLAVEYSKDNTIDIDDLSFSSGKKVKWDFKCGHSGHMTVANRANGKGCRVCNLGFSKESLILVLESLVEGGFDQLPMSIKIATLKKAGVNLGAGSYQKEVKGLISGTRTVEGVVDDLKSDDLDDGEPGESGEEEVSTGLEGLVESDEDILMGIGGTKALLDEEELENQVSTIGDALEMGRGSFTVDGTDEYVEYMFAYFNDEMWKLKFAKESKVL